MLQPYDPNTTISLLRQALRHRPEDVNLEVVFDLVAQLVSHQSADVNGHTNHNAFLLLLASEKLCFSEARTPRVDRRSETRSIAPRSWRCRRWGRSRAATAL